MDKTTLDPAYIDSLGLACGVSAEVRDGRVVVSVGKDDDGESVIVSGPISVPIDATKHYEWTRDAGWRVVKR